MPSQGSQPLSQSFPLCLPLVKLSYATVSNDNIVPIPWIHLSSKNALFAIFETSPVQLEDGRTEDRQKFKVLKDPEVMEELDLNALSLEARRVMPQALAVSSANIPIVAVIVKVPMIAIKYPLANGQIRRFQIRFSKNEDYYEAMKMLARADVPTVEAGTFPSLKPQPAPRPSSVNLVAPDESASQVDGDTRGARICVVNDAMASILASRPAPAAFSAMAPPPMFSAFTNPAEHQLIGQPPTIRPMQTGLLTEPRAAYPKSNVSLSTTTTLVPGKQDYRSYPVQPPILVPPQEVVHDLPPSRQKSPIRSTEQEHSDQHHSLRATRSTPSRTQQCNEDAQFHEAGLSKRESSTKTTGKGKGKRAAVSSTKKAPAAKRSRAAAAPRKGGKPPPKKSPVPTVEELLQQPGYSLLPYDSSAKTRTTPRAQQPVDRPEGLTQPRRQSMEIPESEHGADHSEGGSPELGQAMTTHITRSASRALAYTQSKGLTKQGPTDVTASKSALPPCTPADQIIGKPTTPASPTTQARATPLKARDRHQERMTSLDLPPVTVPAAVGDPLLPVAQQCLVHDENFDLLNADSRLEAWNNLAAPTRLTALRSYLCELILKENFVDLVKNISSLWEGAILEGRMTRSVMATASRDAMDNREEGL